MSTVFRVAIALKKPLLGLLLASLVALPGCDGSKPAFWSIDLTVADFGRDFRLRDPDGKERTLADFRGKVVIVFFGFVQCPQACPTALLRAAAVREKLGGEGANVQVIFVTVDPERTKAVAAEFKVFYAKVPTGSSYTMDHSTMTYVFDRQGRLRLGVNRTSSADEVAADLRTLMQTDSRS